MLDPLNWKKIQCHYFFDFLDVQYDDIKISSLPNPLTQVLQSSTAIGQLNYFLVLSFCFFNNVTSLPWKLGKSVALLLSFHL